MRDTERFYVEYTVRAYFTTRRSSDYVIDPRFPGRFNRVTQYRGWRRLFVYRPSKPHHLCYYQKEVKHHCGGFLGLGQQEATTRITLL